MKIKTIPCILFEHSGQNPKIHRKRKYIFKNIWILNRILLNDEWVVEDTKKENLKTTYQII